jgi:SAM-dependent methyltransferase
MRPIWLSRGDSFQVVLAAHMLYHVPELATAVAEIRRVLAPGGRCVAVTNGEAHIASLRRPVEEVVTSTTPGWKMRDPATMSSSLELGFDPLRRCFESVECVRPPVRTQVLV